MLVGIVSTPDTLILNACGVGSTVGVFYFVKKRRSATLLWLTFANTNCAYALLPKQQSYNNILSKYMQNVNQR